MRKKYSIRKTWLSNVASVILAVLVVYKVSIGIVPSASMVPTLKVGSVMVQKYAHAEDLEYGDIVQFLPDADLNDGKRVDNGFKMIYRKFAYGWNTVYVKRLMGKPGDTLVFSHGTLYRNGEKVDTSFWNEECFQDGIYSVPDGQYFFVGDNVNNSYDSRYFGAIGANRIMAKSILEITPPWASDEPTWWSQKCVG